MKKALHFSGGIDSLALLFFMRPWDDVHVFWVNSGAAHPSTIEQMRRVRELVPHFHEVAGSQPASIRNFGWPADVVPVRLTRMGRIAHGTLGQGLMFQSYFDCCARSLWEPLRQAMLAHDVTDIYRGQRLEDKRRAPVPDGAVDEFGITYHFPIEAWSRQQVLEYCRSECPDMIPDSYGQGEPTSRDCWNCTAYLDDAGARIGNLPPEQRQQVAQVITQLLDAVLGDARGV